MEPELCDRRTLADSEYSNLERLYPECQQRIPLMRLTWDSWAPTSKGDHGNLQLLRGKWPASWCSPVPWYEEGHRGAGLPKLEPPLRAWWVTLSVNGSRLAMGCVRGWDEDRWRSGLQVSTLNLSQHFWSTSYLNMEGAVCWGDELSVPSGLKQSTWEPEHLGMCV